MMPTPSTTGLHRMALTAVLTLCATLNGVTLVWMLARQPHINADFLGFWAYPRFSPLLEIYNPDAMMRFQQALYSGFKSYYPFTYPPDFLLATPWLRDLSYNTAKTVWTLAGFTAFTAAGLGLFKGRPVPVLALLASPAALLTLVLGQTSFFAGALLLGGLALLRERPVLAGIAFGLLTLKPQMGLLLPILLLARGEWKAIVAASLTTGALVALSCAALPPDLWLLWAQSLPQIQRDYFGDGVNLNVMITPAANLVHLGAGTGTAMAAQTACTLVAGCAVFIAARRTEHGLAVAVLLAATLLAQPHAYAYDAVILPAALALGWRANCPAWLKVLGGLVYLAPLAMLSPLASWCLYAPPLALLLAGLTALALKAPRGANSPA